MRSRSANLHPKACLGCPHQEISMIDERVSCASNGPCPRRLSARLRNAARTGVTMLGAWAALPFLAVLALNLIALLLGSALVMPESGRVSLFVITPFLVPFAHLDGLAASLWYSILAIAIVLSAWWTARLSRYKFRRELSHRWIVVEHSPAFLIATMWFALLAVNIACFYLADLISGASSPDFEARPLWQSLASLAHASVWEELVTRVLLIGIPLLVLDAAAKKRKDLRRYILGGDIEIGDREAALMLFSAAMFGLGHLWAWDAYKVIPAAVGGLIMGYLFLKVGLWASITFHFANNFMTMWAEFFPLDVLTATFEVLTLAWAAVGVVFVVYYSAAGLSWLRSRQSENETPAGAYLPANGGNQ